MRRCDNAACPAQVQGKIVHFASRGAMDIDHLGESTIRDLIARGLVTDAGDIFSVTAEQPRLARGGSGPKSVSNLMTAIDAARARSLDRLLIGLGIRHVGTTASRKLAEHFQTLDALEAATLEELAAVDGLGTVIATSLRQALDQPSMQALLAKLRAAGLRLTSERAKREGVFTGYTFVLTGALEKFSRETAEAAIEERGGKITSSVSKKTSYVVVGTEAGTKLAKAEALGVKLLDEAAFVDLLEKGPPPPDPEALAPKPRAKAKKKPKAEEAG